VPILGTTKLHRVEIDEAASEIDVQGARYPEKLEG
jgi:hypothetical protein